MQISRLVIANKSVQYKIWNSLVLKIQYYINMIAKVMAAPIKTCEFCFKTIKDKSYRSLTSNTSQEQYGNIFNKLGIASLNGFVCNQCVNKLNRVDKLNGDYRKFVVHVYVTAEHSVKTKILISWLPSLSSPGTNQMICAY